MVKKGYKQTEIGVIPEDWNISTLETQYNITSSKRVFQSEWRDSGVPFYRAREIAVMGEGVPAPKDLYISEKMYEQYSKQYGAIKENDVLITGVGTLGKVYVVKKDDRFYFKDGNIIWLQWNGRYSSQFLKQLYRTHVLTDQVFGNAGGSTVPTYTITNAKATVVPCPAYQEQCDIAEVLSDTDELIATIEKQIAKKKAIKQGAMQELLTGKKRLPGFDGKWQSFVFGDLFDFIPNNAFTRAQMDVSGRVKNIHYGDILTKYGAYISADSKDIPYIAKEIDLSRFSEKCYLQSGDLVIADTAEDETVGKALEVINVECPVLAGQHTLLCRPKVRFAEKFLGYYLNASCYHDQLLPYIVGTKVSSVSKASIAQTKLVVPKYEEQQEISSILSDMDNDITALEEKLAKYRQVKQGMMQQLLTGKIRLTKDIEDSVQAEQVTSEKAMPLRPVHNHQFDDAVAIAAIVDAFYSDKYPLGRVKVQKLLYLLHRHQGVSVSDFKKKAAGPYADTVRYKGGEPIAKKNKYIVSESGKQGTRYSKGENMTQALDYVERWGMQADMQWLKENFLHTSRNDLELFATVDMAMCDLEEVGISVSVESIKNLIASNKEWKAKLSKTYFSDWDIARAIKKCAELFN